MKKPLCLLLALLIAIASLCVMPAAMSEEMAEKCPDLAVCEGLVWRVDDKAVVCEDVEAGTIRASLPFSDLLEPGESPYRASVATWADDSILLALAVRDATNHRTFRLATLGLTEGGITPLRPCDVNEPLAFLADDGSEWYEVNLVGCAPWLFIAAMDNTYQFHFFSYDLDAGALLPLGKRPLTAYTAALSDGDGVIIAGPSETDDSLLEITRLSLEDGDAEPLDDIILDSTLRAANFAWDESKGLMYYTSNNTVYALSPGSEAAPAAVGMLVDVPAELRRGAVVDNRFVALSESGQLLSCDIQAPVAPTVQLRIADVTGDGCVVEAARSFGVVHPDWSVSVADGIEEANAQAAIETRSPEYDAYVLTLNSELYKAFREADAMADLSSDATLSSAVADMTPRMAAAIRSDGRLLAMPMAVGSTCQCLNVPALEALTGLSREKLPTDWAGFLALLGQLAESGALTGDEYCLYDGGLPAEGLREILFTWMLQDCLMWLQSDASAVERLSKALIPVANAFNETDWSRLVTSGEIVPGASDDSYGGIQPYPDSSASKPLLADEMLDITVAPQIEGMELWPLSIQPGGERLVGQAASVICVSSWSAHPEATLSFVAHAWERANIETRMSLCQSMNTPVANDAYQADLAYMDEDAAMLRQAILEAQSAAEKTWLQEELDQLEAYQADYRENGRWLASAESIARYRGFANALVPTAPYFDFEGPVGTLMLQFLDGIITPEQFAERLAEAVS